MFPTPHQVTVTPSKVTTDAYGNVTHGPDPDTSYLVKAFIQPREPIEDRRENERQEVRAVMYVRAADEAGVALRQDGWSYVDWDGQRYEIVGQATPYDLALPGLRHHYKLNLRWVR